MANQVAEDLRQLANRYRLIVYWSNEDQKFIGLCPELFYGGTHGRDAEKVFQDLRELVEDEIEDRLSRGDSLPEPSKEIAFY
jgi:predicted RNase H-like HicB family nuclease